MVNNQSEQPTSSRTTRASNVQSEQGSSQNNTSNRTVNAQSVTPIVQQRSTASNSTTRNIRSVTRPYITSSRGNRYSVSIESVTESEEDVKLHALQEKVKQMLLSFELYKYIEVSEFIDLAKMMQKHRDSLWMDFIEQFMCTKMRIHQNPNMDSKDYMSLFNFIHYPTSVFVKSLNMEELNQIRFFIVNIKFKYFNDQMKLINAKKNEEETDIYKNIEQMFTHGKETKILNRRYSAAYMKLSNNELINVSTNEEFDNADYRVEMKVYNLKEQCTDPVINIDFYGSSENDNDLYAEVGELSQKVIATISNRNENTGYDTVE
ncbi:hypothetical protein [Drosophila suzukii associated hytrosavirus 1]|nr:hypothetical protein [Drosophila suzukii associated hytrosavirus 1]